MTVEPAQGTGVKRGELVVERGAKREQDGNSR
jgi:hypothetical protein